MSERIHVLAQQLLGKPSVEACQLEEIRDLVNRYPFFAPAQFLLLEKLKLENDLQYTSQLQKAVLYYHNPLAFEYFISSEKFYTELEPEFSEMEDPGVALAEINRHSEEEFTSSDSLLENGMKEDLPGHISFTGNEHLNDTTETEVVDHSESANNMLPEDALTGEEITEEENFKMREVDFGLNEVKEDRDDKVKDDTSIPSSPLPATGSPIENDIVFEPYHTVDYFASQGIKLSQEELPKDKFGRQLKSFTEWLKTMKKLPAKEAVTDAGTEQNVQHMADDSVHQSEVVTEAMAEVWLKQGNNEKALEIYQQLCLLNPSKNAYFAALIENLKRS